MRQQLLYVFAFPVPGKEPMRREGMTYIVQARLITRPIGATNICEVAKPDKGCLYDAPLDGSSGTKNKKWCFVCLRVAVFLPPPSVLGHNQVQPLPKGNKARLVELCLADDDQGFLKIHVAQRQSERFAHPKAGAVKEQQNSSERVSFKLYMISLKSSCAFQKAAKLAV
jgi:hypothetical protein